ncbi:MAG: hypothetical protein CMO26_23755 [Thiotrichales bacterium]|nr:hypothetical protein [Thiotrichales bacterium]
MRRVSNIDMDVKNPKSDQESRIPTTLLVCINRRIGMKFGKEMPSCGGRGSEALADLLELGLSERGLSERMKVERFYCFGRCDDGPNVRYYPGGTCFSNVGGDDVATILDTLEEALGEVPRLSIRLA